MRGEPARSDKFALICTPQLEEEGFKYLRINVTRLDDGRAQLARPAITDADGEALYRLRAHVYLTAAKLSELRALLPR